MTTRALAPDPVTARVFLLGEGHGPASVAALQAAMEERGVAGLATEGIGKLSTGATQAVRQNVASVVDGLLQVDLADFVVGGWKTHTALVAAARRTWGAPGTVEVVDLYAHTVTSTYEPYVEVLVETLRVARIDIALTVSFTVTGVAASVRDGALVALTGGRCDVQAELAVHGVPVCRKSGSYNPSLLVPLRGGVPLLRSVGADDASAPT